MARGTDSRKKAGTTAPRRTVAIGLSAVAGGSPGAAKNWRQAAIARPRVRFRRFVLSALAALPLLAAASFAAAPLREVRELRISTPAQRSLSRLLERVRKNRSLVDARVRARELTAEEGARLRHELAAVEKKARSLTKRSRKRLEQGLRSLDMELDELGQKIRT